MWDPEGTSIYLVLPAPGIPHKELGEAGCVLVRNVPLESHGP